VEFVVVADDDDDDDDDDSLIIIPLFIHFFSRYCYFANQRTHSYKGTYFLKIPFVGPFAE
jgi:hypothetical protein